MGQGRLDEQCGGRAGSPAFWAISGLAWADPWAAGVAPCPAWPQGLWLFRALPAPCSVAVAAGLVLVLALAARCRLSGLCPQAVEGLTDLLLLPGEVQLP